MIQFPPVRSLMQAKEDDFEFGPHLLIVPGVLVSVTIAFMLLVCLYSRLRDRQVATQNRKYANWTDQDQLLEEFSKKEVNPGRQNPLEIAIRLNNLPLVKKLVEEGHQQCDSIDREGCYALHYATASQSMEMIRYIAEHTPKEFRPEGHSPLHVAARNDDFDALSYLIQNFPELQKNLDGSRRTYLEVLCTQSTGSPYHYRCLKSDKKYGQFIHTYRPQIPKELFRGVLTPYSDFSQDQVAIEMDVVDSETKTLLEV